MRDEQNCPGKSTVYTIVQTGVNVDLGYFPDPIAWGSYSSIDLAREQLARLIAAKKETLNNCYDKEERTEDCWEAYADGYATACFVRIEILTSSLVPAPKGGAHDA